MGSVYRRESAIRRAKALPFAGFLVLLASCSQPGGQASQTADTSGTGESAGVMNVADAAIAGGDPQMALKVSQSVLTTDPKNLDALYHEGAAYYAINRCVDAIAAYNVALSVDPKSSDAELGIGRCLLKRDAAQAEIAFQAAIADNPSNAAALNDLGIARDLQGNHAGAVQPYQQALLINPGNMATEVNLGMSLALSGNGNEALQYLGPLATSPDATPKIRQDYAMALVAAGRQDEARQVLAVDLPPEQVASLLNDFSAVIETGQVASSQAAAGQAAAGQAAAGTSASYPATVTPVDSSAPVAQTALVAPPASAAQSQAPAVAPPAEPVAAPPPVVAAAAPAPVHRRHPSLKPAPAVVKTAAAPAPVQPAAVAPQTASPQTASPAVASPPATAMVASLPAITPSVDAPPSDNIPPAVTPPAAASVKPASSPPPAPAAATPPAPPAKPKSTWWNLLRAPTGQ